MCLSLLVEENKVKGWVKGSLPFDDVLPLEPEEYDSDFEYTDMPELIANSESDSDEEEDNQRRAPKGKPVVQVRSCFNPTVSPKIVADHEFDDMPDLISVSDSSSEEEEPRKFTGSKGKPSCMCTCRAQSSKFSCAN